MDKTGLGLITVAELSKQLQEVAGCSAAEAESLVWSGSAWRDIIPNGKGQMVDYKLFCLCVRLADKEEVALLSNLSNPELQAARMAVLMQSPAFKDILSECQGAVSPKQCEQLLVDKGTLSKMWVLRRILMPMGVVDAMEFLLGKLRETKTNQDFFDSMNQ